jgi:hypothetical protein
MKLNIYGKKLQVAIFSGSAQSVQKDVNNWLANSVCMITGIEQNYYEHLNENGITITIIYDPDDVSAMAE